MPVVFLPIGIIPEEVLTTATECIMEDIWVHLRLITDTVDHPQTIEDHHFLIITKCRPCPHKEVPMDLDLTATMAPHREWEAGTQDQDMELHTELLILTWEGACHHTILV